MQSTSVIFLLGFSLFLAVSSEEIKWCCGGIQECNKCDALKAAVSSDVSTKANSVSCVEATNGDECVKKVVAKEADIMSMDGGDIFENIDKLYPVTTEVYDANKPDLQGAAYYAVAFVKKNSDVSLDQLKGRKTCHTGAGRSAGWKIPMGYLFSQKYIDWTSDCNQYYSAADFFKESCVPGVKNKVKDNSKVDNLCAICSGTGSNKCVDSSEEPYDGYVGAFKCMFDGAGEVAFAKQSTFDDAGSGYGVADDYRLLCKNGSKKAITDYKDCNLGKNPAHAVTTAREDKATTYADWLKKVDAAFGNDPSKSFQLYNSSTADYMGKDLLFKDSTKMLKKVSDQSAKEYLGEAYIQNTKGLTACVSSSGSVFILSYTIFSLALALVYFLN